MATFMERFSFNKSNPAQVDLLKIADIYNRMTKAHKYLQDMEAPEKVFKDDRSALVGTQKALFHFLDAFGYYPDTVINKGVSHSIKNWRAITPASLGGAIVRVIGESHRGGFIVIGLLGPNAPDEDKDAVPIQMIEDFLISLFPHIVIQTSTTLAADGQAVYHVSVREKFMQTEKDNHEPVANGSAENRNAMIALMQAAIRMEREMLLDSMAATMIDLVPFPAAKAFASAMLAK